MDQEWTNNEPIKAHKLTQNTSKWDKIDLFWANQKQTKNKQNTKLVLSGGEIMDKSVQN